MTSREFLKFGGIAIGFVVALGVAGFGALVVRGALRNRAQHPAERFTASPETPQGAVRLYEAALARRDIDAMASMRAFHHEAQALLERQGKTGPEWTGFAESTAVVLEQAFRAQWDKLGWPDLRGARSYFGEPLSLGDDVVTMAERTEFPDRAVERAQLYLVKRGGSWKLFTY